MSVDVSQAFQEAFNRCITVLSRCSDQLVIKPSTLLKFNNTVTKLHESNLKVADVVAWFENLEAACKKENLIYHGQPKHAWDNMLAMNEQFIELDRLKEARDNIAQLWKERPRYAKPKAPRKRQSGGEDSPSDSVDAD